MRRVIALLLVVVLACTLLSGCNKSNEGKEIVVATWAGDPFESAWKAKALEYEKATGVKVVVDAVPWENLREKCALELANKTGSYDVLYVHPSWFGAFQKNNYLLPITDYVTKEELSEYVPNLLDSYTVNGKTYGLPDFITTQVLAYRKDIFVEKNLKVPQSFEELLSVCEALSGNESYAPITFPAKKGGTLASVFNAFLISNGGWFYGKDGNLTINSKEAVETAELFAKLAKYAPSGYLNNHWDENSQVAAGGKAAMAVIGTINSVWLEDKDKSATFDKWAYAPIKSSKGPGGMVDDYCWSVASDSKNVKEAGDFVKFISGTDSQIYFTEVSGTCGATKGYYANTDMQNSMPVLIAMQETLKNTQHAPTWTTWSTEQEVLEVAIQDVMTGKLTPQEAIKIITEAMK